MEILSTDLSMISEWRGKDFFTSIFNIKLDKNGMYEHRDVLKLTNENDKKTLKKIIFWQFAKLTLDSSEFTFLKHSHNFYRNDKYLREKEYVLNESIKKACSNFITAKSKWFLDWSEDVYISLIWFLAKISANKEEKIEAIKLFLDKSSFSRNYKEPLKRKSFIIGLLKSDEFKSIWSSLDKKFIIDELFWKDALKECLK
jgi:hypothetical protein